MARVLITGSTTGLGLAAARELLAAGHEVVLHARNEARRNELGDILPAASGVVIGDLANAREVHSVAATANAIGEIDAVIHNAAVYSERQRGSSDEGHAVTLAVNVLAPYLLTAGMNRPARLVYVTSGMHRGGSPSLLDIDWRDRRWNGMQAYSDSKLFVTAFAFLLARRWPDVRVHAVDPGWVPTRMGGPGASDDLELGHRTQTWLAVSDDREAASSGGYWFHQERQVPAAATTDHAFQEALLAELTAITGVRLP